MLLQLYMQFVFPAECVIIWQRTKGHKENKKNNEITKQTQQAPPSPSFLSTRNTTMNI